jgi:hypothetical protein
MPKTYEPIATNTLGSDAASVTFSSIPSTYTDLVLVSNYRLNTGDNFLILRFNSDTGSNYSFTNAYTEGTTAASDRATSQTSARIGFYGSAQSNSIVNIMNYSNTTTNKTAVSRDNTNTYVITRVNLWRNTSAITSITILTPSPNITSGSTFTLYGIKAA